MIDQNTHKLIIKKNPKINAHSVLQLITNEDTKQINLLMLCGLIADFINFNDCVVKSHNTEIVTPESINNFLDNLQKVNNEKPV